jgi:hypothetical protein
MKTVSAPFGRRDIAAVATRPKKSAGAREGLSLRVGACPEAAPLRGEELLAPLAQQAVGDVVLAAELAIDFSASSDASSISVFCWAVNRRYFLVSLNACLLLLSRPIPEAHRTESPLRRHPPRLK